MRKFTFIIVKACLVLLAERSTGQTITLSVSNVPLDTVFSKIQEQSPYRFVYTSEELVGTKKVSFSVQKVPIEAVLGLSFKGQPVDYSMEDQYIYVRKKKESKILPTFSNQTSEIRGKITNELGDPLEGATIQINKLDVQTLTNAKGEFVFRNIINGDYKLEITFIGYEKYTTIVKAGGNEALIVVAMKRSMNNLDETVIKGYYTTTNRLNTGDVTTIKAEDIQKQPVSSPLMALEGRVPGLQITQTSGAPGRTMSVLLRGQNSIASGTSPLYIIDGVPFNSSTLDNASFIGGASDNSDPFNTINPLDIESVSVLKDADATAIYGSRGANGVILITTKKGKSGQTKVDLTLNEGAGRATRFIKLLNDRQYLEMRHEAFNNDGATPGLADYDVNGVWDTARYTDWQKELIGGTTKYSNAQLSISGGNENTQFLIGGGFHKESTIYPGDFSDQRASVHASMSHASSDKRFRTSFSVFYSEEDNILPQTDFTGLINLPPDAPSIYDSLGNLNWANSTWTNPFASLLQKNKGVTDNLIGNLSINYRILPSVEFSASLGYNTLQLHQVITSPLSSINPAYTFANAILNVAGNSIKTWIAEPQINYHKQIGQSQLNLLVGSTFQQNLQNSLAQTGTGFPSDVLINNLSAASVITINNVGYTQYRYAAVFGRINYMYNDKYLLNITGRRDGSSRFGQGNQFADFGAIGAGWVFSKEKFTKAFKLLSFGKIRVSYGITGNDQIGDYQFLDTYEPYQASYLGVTGLQPVRLANPDFAWEIDKKQEIGAELGFLNDRIFLNANYYRNRSSNQLINYPLPSITGNTSVTANLPAFIENYGFEFLVNTKNIQTRDFNWATSFNLTIPRNKLLAFPELSSSPYQFSYVVGQPMTIAKRFENTGVDKQTGAYTFNDYDHDGMISFPNDYQDVINTGQQFYGGIQNTFRYKAFELQFFFQFVKRNNGPNFLSSIFQLPGTMSNQPVYVLDRWQKPGDVKPVQRYNQDYTYYGQFANAQASNIAFSDASYIRFKNASFSYQIPLKWIRQMRVRAFDVFVQAQNLFTITKYKGFDPEIGSFLPPIRVVTFGGHLTF